MSRVVFAVVKNREQLIMSMTSAWLQGQKTQLSRQESCVCRPC
ncbi:hypothetical protein [Trichormus azollae]|nr:hypothetical protein [Trichormus azollae]